MVQISAMRYSMDGYDARTDMIRDIAPLITQDLTKTDLKWLMQGLKIHVHDLSGLRKTFMPDEDPEIVNGEMKMHADLLVEVLQSVKEALDTAFPDKGPEIAELITEVQNVAAGEAVAMERPQAGAQALKSPKVKISLRKWLDVVGQYQFMEKVVNRKFDIDGHYHDGMGDYLHEDFYLTKDQGIAYLTATILRASKEMTNPEFDPLTFLKEKVGDCFRRIDPTVRDQFNNIISPFLAPLKQMVGDVNEFKNNAIAEAEMKQRQYEDAMMEAQEDFQEQQQDEFGDDFGAQPMEQVPIEDLSEAQILQELGGEGSVEEFGAEVPVDNWGDEQGTEFMDQQLTDDAAAMMGSEEEYYEDDMAIY